MPSALPTCTRNRVPHAQAKSGCRRGLIHMPFSEGREAQRRPCRAGSGSSAVSSANGSASSEHRDRDRDVAGLVRGDHGGHQHGAEHEAERLRDADPAGDPAALGDRHPVGHGRGQRGEHRVEAGLRRHPDQRDADDRALLGEQDQRGRAEHRAADRPDVPAAQLPPADRAGRCGRRTRRPAGWRRSRRTRRAPVTQASIVSLSAGAIDSTCCGSRIWIGVKNAIQTPRLAANSRPIQRSPTRTVGSASAAGRDAGVGSTVVTDVLPVPVVGALGRTPAGERSRRGRDRTAW